MDVLIFLGTYCAGLRPRGGFRAVDRKRGYYVLVRGGSADNYSGAGGESLR